jgi:hypothetical protein
MRGVDSSSTLGQALGTTKIPFSSAPGRKVNAPVAPVAPVAAAAPAAAPVAAAAPAAAPPVEPAAPASPDDIYKTIGRGLAAKTSEEASNVLGQAYEADAKAKGELAAEQQKQDALAKRREADLAQSNADKVRDIIAKQQKILDGEYGHFAPTQETAGDIMGLFSMLTIATMGAGTSGKYSGMNAMAALSGAMKGYKEGREDVYKKEMDSYNKNLEAFTKHQQNQLKQMDLAMKELSTDKDAAMARLKQIAAEDAGGIVALQIRSGQTGAAMNRLEEQVKSLRTLEEKGAALAEKKAEAAQREADRQEELRLKRQDEARREARDAELRREAGARESRLLTAIGEKGDLVTLKDGTLARVVGNKIVPIEGGAGATKLGTPAKNAADDVASYLSSKGINIADKKDRAAVQSAVDAYSTLQSLKDLVSDDPNLVGRQGQIRQFTDKYYKSFKGEGPAVNESDVKQDDQAALRFAKAYASMLTRYERALADGGRSGSTVSFQNRYNDLLSQNQFNPAGLAALMNDMQDEMTKMARVKSPKISHSMMEEMATEFGAGLQATPSKAAPAAGGATEKLPPNPDRHFIGTEPIIPNKDNTGWIYEKTGKAVK